MSAISLEKYQAGGRNRYTCPQCGKHKVFTRYVKDGQYLADHVGRCNRESNCGYHFTPREFFNDNPSLGKDNTKWRKSDAWKEVYQPSKSELSLQTLPRWVFEETQAAPDCNFVRFLAKTFGTENAQELRRKFCIGSNSDLWPNSTVFWLLGADGTPYSAQVVLYDPGTGKRQKNSWIHTALKSRFAKNEQVLPDWLESYEHAPKYPFPFGLHLISNCQEKPIAVVESAKTAIIMTAIQPKALWLAIGGLSYLNEHRLEELKGLDIVLYPDLGAFKNWKIKADELKSKGFKISISDLVESTASDLDRQQGFDIADYLLKKQRALKSTEFKPNIERKIKDSIDDLPSWLTLHPDGININDKPLQSLNLEQRKRFHLHILDAAKTDPMMKAVWDCYWLEICT